MRFVCIRAVCTLRCYKCSGSDKQGLCENVTDGTERLRVVGTGGWWSPGEAFVQVVVEPLYTDLCLMRSNHCD